MQSTQEENGTRASAAVRDYRQSLPELRQHASFLTTDALKAELSRLLGLTAENLVRLAIVIQELEKRGEDFGQVRFGLLPILRKIASGELLPDLVVKFAGEPSALRQAAALPIEEQRQVATGQRTVTARIRGPRGPRIPDDDDVEVPAFIDRDAITNVALSGSPKDIGEMAADLLAKCSDTMTAIASLAERLAEVNVITRQAARAVVAAIMGQEKG